MSGSRYIVPFVDFAVMGFPATLSPSAIGEPVANSMLTFHGNSSERYISFHATTKHTAGECVLDSSEVLAPSGTKQQHLGEQAIFNGDWVDCEEVSVNLYPSVLQSVSQGKQLRELEQLWEEVRNTLHILTPSTQICVGTTVAINVQQALSLSATMFDKRQMQACLSGMRQLRETHTPASSFSVRVARHLSLANECIRSLQTTQNGKSSQLSLSPFLSQRGAELLRRRILAQLQRYSTTAQEDTATSLAQHACVNGKHKFLNTVCTTNFQAQGSLRRRIRRRQTLQQAATLLGQLSGPQPVGQSAADVAHLQRTIRLQNALQVASIPLSTAVATAMGSTDVLVAMTWHQKRSDLPHTQWLSIVPQTTAEINSSQPQELFRYKLCAGQNCLSPQRPSAQDFVQSPSELLLSIDEQGSPDAHRTDSQWDTILTCFSQHETASQVVDCSLSVLQRLAVEAEQCQRTNSSCAQTEIRLSVAGRIVVEQWSHYLLNVSASSFDLGQAIVDNLTCTTNAAKFTVHASTQAESLAKAFKQRFAYYFAGKPYFTLLGTLASECSRSISSSVQVLAKGSSLWLRHELRSQSHVLTEGVRRLIQTGSNVPLTIFRGEQPPVESTMPLRLASEIDHPSLSSLASRLWAASMPLLGPIEFKVPISSNESWLAEELRRTTAAAPSEGSALFSSQAWENHHFEAYLHYLTTHQRLTTIRSALHCHTRLLSKYAELAAQLKAEAGGTDQEQCIVRELAPSELAVSVQSDSHISLTASRKRSRDEEDQPALCVLPPLDCATKRRTAQGRFKEEPDPNYCVVCKDLMGAMAADRPIII